MTPVERAPLGRGGLGGLVGDALEVVEEDGPLPVSLAVSLAVASDGHGDRAGDAGDGEQPAGEDRDRLRVGRDECERAHAAERGQDRLPAVATGRPLLGGRGGEPHRLGRHRRRTAANRPFQQDLRHRLFDAIGGDVIISQRPGRGHDQNPCEYGCESASAATRMGWREHGPTVAPCANQSRPPFRNGFVMEQNTTRIALAVDGRRVDLTVPARRPVGEFLPQLADLAGPHEWPAHGWHLVRVGGDLIDAERSLAESAVLDGELIQLAPALAAPSGADVVDDVPTAVTEAAGSGQHAATTRRHLCHALAAAAAVGLSLSLVAGGIAGGAVAAVLTVAVLAGAAALRMSGHDVDASIWAFTAIVPATVAGWTIGRGTSVEVWWAPAVIAGALAAVGAAVAVPARHSVLVPLASGLVAAAAWCVVFATWTREPGAVGGPAVILGFVVIDAVPRLAFHALGVGRLHRGSRSRDAVDGRVRRARVMIVAGNVTGSVLVVIGSGGARRRQRPVGLDARRLGRPRPRPAHPALHQPRRAGAGRVRGRRRVPAARLRHDPPGGRLGIRGRGERGARRRAGCGRAAAAPDTTAHPPPPGPRRDDLRPADAAGGLDVERARRVAVPHRTRHRWMTNSRGPRK